MVAGSGSVQCELQRCKCSQTGNDGEGYQSLGLPEKDVKWKVESCWKERKSSWAGRIYMKAETCFFSCKVSRKFSSFSKTICFIKIVSHIYEPLTCLLSSRNRTSVFLSYSAPLPEQIFSFLFTNLELTLYLTFKLQHQQTCFTFDIAINVFNLFEINLLK